MESSQFGVFAETRFPDFQIVIIVDYDDGRMFPLTEDCPKCLLPIANRKLLAYQLDLLKKCGAREIFVVSPQDYYPEVSKFLSEYLSEELFIELVAVSDMMGSADGLRALRDRLRGDFIIWNSDMISQVTLGEMAYKHRLQSADLTVLLASPPVDESAEGGKKAKGSAPALAKIDQEDAEYIAMNNLGRLLMKTPVLEVDNVVSVSKALLGRTGGGAEGFSLHTNLLDTGVYIMSHWLLELVVNSDHISSLRTDLVPYLVNRQFQPAAHLQETLPGLKHRHRSLHALEPYLSGLTATSQSPYMPLLRRNAAPVNPDMDATHTSLGREVSSAQIAPPPPYPVDPADILRCFAVIAPAAAPNAPLLCQRVTSIPVYVALNRDLPKLYTQPDSPWGRVANYRKKELSTVGENADIADKVTIKLCSIGNNVKIGARSKVNSSVIMENVTIGDNPQVSIAPGMSTALLMEFRATSIGDFDCALKIVQASDRSLQKINITATVITHDAFKRISRALALDSAKTSLYAPGVKCVGQIPPEGGDSYLSGAPSVFTENMIDDEDLEDLMDFPLFENVYWNPITRSLCVDEELSAVATHPEWTVEQSQREDTRLCELEAMGMCTHRVLERLMHKSISKSHTVDSLQVRE